MTDDELWGAFTTRTLPEADWTHRAHVRVAWLHVCRWPTLEAHLRMRVGIIRLNVAHGLEETATRGYHETLTLLWVRAVAASHVADRAAGREARDSDAFCAAHPELLDATFPLRFFSRERLFSLEARATALAPDLVPWP